MITGDTLLGKNSDFDLKKNTHIMKQESVSS